jgi:putative flippase GtrA
MARRWGTFNLVGIAGFMLQFGVLTCLTRVWGWHYVAATVVAVEVAIVSNYLAHARWTWSDRSGRTRWERLARPLRYQAATTVTMMLNVALTAVFVSRAAVSPEAANVAAVALCALVNFVAADRLVFPDPARTG